MISNQKIKGTFITFIFGPPLFFKWMGVSQPLLDCFSIGVRAVMQNIYFFILLSFVYWCPIFTTFKCSNLQFYYNFFQVSQFGPLFFKWMRVFQSLLDCFSIRVWALMQNIYFFILRSFCMLVSIFSLFTFFKCSNSQFHYNFFQVSQIWRIFSKDINLQTPDSTKKDSLAVRFEK